MKKSTRKSVESAWVKWSSAETVSSLVVMHRDGTSIELRGAAMYIWLDEFGRRFLLSPSRQSYFLKMLRRSERASDGNPAQTVFPYV